MVEITAKDRAADAAYELATSQSDGLEGARQELNQIWSSGNLSANDIGQTLKDNNLLAPLTLYDSTNLDYDQNDSLSFDELDYAANSDSSDTLTKVLAQNLASEVIGRNYQDLPLAEVRAAAAAATPNDPIPGDMSFDPSKFSDGQVGARDLAYASENFDRLDKDADGYIRSDEIDDYLKSNSNSITQEDAAIMRDLSSQVSNLEEGSNDEWGDEDSGITREDLRAAAEKTAGDLNASTDNTGAPEALQSDLVNGNADSPATADTVLSGQENQNETTNAALARLSDAASSTEDQLAAIKTLVDGGQTTATIRDADGNALNIRMEVQPISEGSDRNYVQMFAVDDSGRETVVLRAVSDANGFSQQRDANGNFVSYVGSKWSSGHPESVFGD